MGDQVSGMEQYARIYAHSVTVSDTPVFAMASPSGLVHI